MGLILCSSKDKIEFTFVILKSKVIITSTCAVNTDQIAMETVGTQTVMPRSDVAFKKYLKSKHTIQYADDDDSNEDENEYSARDTEDLFNIETRLRSKKKLHRQKSSPRPEIDIVIEDATSSDVTREASFEKSPKRNSSPLKVESYFVDGGDQIYSCNFRRKPTILILSLKTAFKKIYNRMIAKRAPDQ